MPKKLDLTNQRFGKLIALYSTHKNGKTAWHCKCDCGNELDVFTFCLRNGNTSSCGCEKIKNELIILKNNLITKTEEILNLEKNLNQKKQDLNKKEENIEKLKEQYNNVLIVEVPDTYKKSNIKYISKKLILIGIIFIINATLNKRKKYD